MFAILFRKFVILTQEVPSDNEWAKQSHLRLKIFLQALILLIRIEDTNSIKAGLFATPQTCYPDLKIKISKILDLIAQKIKMFPTSSFHLRLGRVVLPKQTSVIYEVIENSIFLVNIFCNYEYLDALK